MKPDTRQDESLKKYLLGELTYQETYEEVYDHVLSALQNVPVSVPFEVAVNTIIKDDFGGPGNLIKVEEACKKAIIKDVRRQQLNYFVSFFKFPNLLYLIGFSVLVYLILAITPLTRFTVTLLFLALAFIPNLVLPLKYFSTHYIWGNTKRSVLNNTMGNLGLFLFRIFWAGISLLIIAKNGFNFQNNFDPFYVTIGVVLFVVYTLAFYRLSKNKFNTNPTK